MTTNDRTVLSPRELQAIEEHKYYMSQNGQLNFRGPNYFCSCFHLYTKMV